MSKYASMQVILTPTDTRLGQVALNVPITQGQFDAIKAAHRTPPSFVYRIIQALKAKP